MKKYLQKTCYKAVIAIYRGHVVQMINDKENVNNLDDLTVCETKFCGIIDQTLFYIDLTVLYIQNFENFT